MKIVFSLFCFLSLLFFSCEQNPDPSKTENFLYQADEIVFQQIRFFKRKKNITTYEGELDSKELAQFLKYYKVYFYRESSFPLREELYKEQLLDSWARFHYSDYENFELKSIQFYNTSAQLVREEIYQNLPQEKLPPELSEELPKKLPEKELEEIESSQAPIKIEF